MSSAPPGYIALLRTNAAYRRLWIGMAASMIGDWLRTLALYHVVLNLTGASGLALGGVMLAQTLSLFLFSPLAGVIADRMNRKAIMVSADLLRAILTLGFLAITTADRVWLAYVLTATLTVVSAFFHPAYLATIPNITSRQELLTANALASATWAAMLALGAALGGMLAAWLGTTTAFVLDMLTYLVSAWCIATLVIPLSQTPQREHSGWHDFWCGLHYIATRGALLRLLSVKACSAGISGGLLVLLALFAERIFDAGAMGMGWLYAARGLGAFCGPPLAHRYIGKETGRMYRSLGIAFLLTGGAHVAFAGTPTVAWACVALFIAAMAANVLWAFSTTLLQLSVPDAYRGRIFAADFTVLTVVMSLSTWLTGWGIDAMAISLRSMATLLGVLLLLPALWWLPWLWRRPPDIASDPGR